MVEDVLDTPGPSKGASASIVQEFTIEGLYGYRSIGLSSPYAATILIAKNGTGKTTLLGALDAFLRMQLGRLRSLDFHCLRCKILGVSDELVLTHDDVISFLQIPDDPEFLRTAARASLEPKFLFNFLVDEYISTGKHDRHYQDNKIYGALLSSFSYNNRELDSTLERINDNIFLRIKNIHSLRNTLKQVLNDVQIVYLPTYRRIELSLTDEDDSPPYRKRRGPRLAVASGSLFTGDIHFGLGDIADRLSEINSEIVYSSSNGYREISANIINDLIGGLFEQESFDEDITPKKDELSLFFSRLREGRRVGNFASVKAPDLEKLYDPNQVPSSSRKFLSYFLNQLGTVIKSTKAIEEPVDLFIDSCNKYLLSNDPSTSFSDDEAEEGKKLRLNRQNLNVYVESVPDGKKISLNALSSGEKQMISLFAKLFLYPKNKIVLIDEPELSLSIEWQSKILVDVLNAPLCKQVIAITHSPFVFDNELDPFARALLVKNASSTEAHDESALDFGDEDGE